MGRDVVKRLFSIVTVILLVSGGASIWANPSYIVPPDGTESVMTTLFGSGADSERTAELTVSYWYDVDSNYDYFAYQVFNGHSGGGDTFWDYISYLSIGNPLGAEYWVTGSASSSGGGNTWIPDSWSSSPNNVSWSAPDEDSRINPPQTSTTDPYFEFAVEHTGGWGWVPAEFRGMDGNDEVYAYGKTIAPVPEPGTMILLGSLASGLFGAAGIRRRFK